MDGSQFMDRNVGIQTRVGNTEVTGVRQEVTVNVLCNEMPTSPLTMEFNYLHICNNGQGLPGRYVIVRGIEPLAVYFQIAEVFIWNIPQPADKSEEHSKKKFQPIIA